MRKAGQESISIIPKGGPEAFPEWLSVGIEGKITNGVFIGSKFFSCGATVIVIKVRVMTKP
jgi:hypothetical protein